MLRDVSISRLTKRLLRALAPSLKDVAEEADVNYNTLSSWRSGNRTPSAENVIRLVELAEERARVLKNLSETIRSSLPGGSDFSDQEKEKIGEAFESAVGDSDRLTVRRVEHEKPRSDLEVGDMTITVKTQGRGNQPSGIIEIAVKGADEIDIREESSPLDSGQQNR